MLQKMVFYNIESYLCHKKMETLPLKRDLETKKILKKLSGAHRALAELKGIATGIPNKNILINSLGLQEAKDSSAIENIITTHDELYQEELNIRHFKSQAAKEIQNYVAAIKLGFHLISENQILTNNTILQIQATIEKNNAGFRKLPGTELKNQQTGKTVYTPPQDSLEIQELMSNLELFINDDTLSDNDPIVKMAIIHFQFESIHPFYDGNGRTGRIINVLYLILQNLLDLPILYLSQYIVKNKVQYYQLLQEVRETNEWENWLLYIIKAVEVTAKDTTKKVKEIQTLMLKTKHIIRTNYKFYSQDLLNNLFSHPYTKIEFLAKDLGVSRQTAAKHLNQLTSDGVLVKRKLGNTNFYINSPLFEILTKN